MKIPISGKMKSSFAQADGTHVMLNIINSKIASKNKASVYPLLLKLLMQTIAPIKHGKALNILLSIFMNDICFLRFS